MKVGKLVADPSVIIGSIVAAVPATLAAWAVVTKARGTAGRPLQVLRRVWDWLEQAGHRAELERRNPTLHGDVIRVLSDDDKDDQ